MRPAVSPWAGKFDVALSGHVVRQKLRSMPGPLKDLDAMRLEEGAQTLDYLLQEVHVASDQELQVMAQIIGTAKAYASIHHADAPKHVEMLYADLEQRLGTEPPTKIITSLAGIGKSALSKALEKLLGPPSKVELPNHGQAMIHGGIRIKIGVRTRHVDLLNAAASAVGEGTPFSTSSQENQAKVRHMLYSHGCCYIVADEMQFMTQSDAAHTQVAKTITFLRQMGVPLFVIANYSLGHRLLKRPQEERHRLLSDPIILLPDLPSDASFIELLKAYKTACSPFLDIDPEGDAIDIHWLTGGIKRILRMLVVQGFRVAKKRAVAERSSVVVRLSELREGYNSPGFGMARTDVEDWRLILGGTVLKHRKDLSCPFELSPSQLEKRQALLEQALSSERGHAILRASMTAAEVKGVQALGQDLGLASSFLPPKPATDKVKRPKKTVESLRRGLKHSLNR